MAAIKHQGINFGKARGIEGPRGIYADPGSKDEHGNIKGFYGAVHKTPTVEFHIHKDRWHAPFVTGDDVKKDEVIAAHHPWHSHARYILQDKKLHKDVLAGKHDNLLRDPDYGKAIRFVKHGGRE